MATPSPTSALPSTTYKYPPKVVDLRTYADSISRKIIDLKSKRDPTGEHVSAQALLIADAVESACAARSVEVLEPFAAVAVEEIVRLFSSCCAALDAAHQRPRFGAKLSAFAARATSRSPSPSPGELTSLGDYRASLEAVKALLRIVDGQSQLVYSGTLAPLAARRPALLHDAISKSTVVNQVYKTTLQTMANITDGLPFPCKAVAQTVLQLHQHGEAYRTIDSSIGTLIRKVDDFVEVLAKPDGQNIAPGEDIARAVERFFSAVQSIIIRLEILRATAKIKKLVAPTAVKTAVADAQADLDDARRLLDMALQVDTNNSTRKILHAQGLAKSNVNYSSELPASPRILHGRDGELSRLVSCVVDRSRPIRVAIMGAGGLGKTTLANAVVQHVDVAATFGARRFLVTAEAAVEVDDLLTGMLATFGLPASSDPLASLLQHFRSHERTLLVIDNLETIWNSANAQQRRMTEDVLSKLDNVTSLTLIITCRGADLPPDVEWANRDAVVLSTLSPAAALATFTDIAGNVPAPDQPVRDALLKEVDYMPLAVTLLARLVSRGKQLRDLHRRWNSVHTGMLRTQPNGRLDNVDASVQLSIAFLPSDDPAPLQLLSLCAQLPDGMRLPVRNELEGLCGFRDIDGALDVIQGLALVYVTDDDTIRMLSPIRLYMLEKHRPSAAHRAYLLEIYYEIARHAPRDIDPQFPGARDRILPELSNLDALLSSEIRHFDELPSPDLIDAVNVFSSFSRLHVPNERMLTALIPRIEHLPESLALSLWILAEIHWCRNAYNLSLEAATRARSLYQSLSQRLDAARCDQQMGNIHRLKSNYTEAIASLSAARETFNELDRELDVAYCDKDLALVFYEQGNHDDAAALFTSAQEVFLRLDEPANGARCQEMLGDIYRIRGDYQAAETQLESALQTYTSLGSMSDIATCSCALGDVYRSQQCFDAALERLQVAYDIGQKQGNTLGVADALRFRSCVHRDQGQFAQARQLLLDAQRLCEFIEYTRGAEDCAEALDELDRVEHA
ncbi:hypothetical protein EXIGLDRAFT_835597 [Exidia glandulosa HHB12029]|uniref:ORC1/DEAH AAA+ ATPase domain-containing protein n=1 Tax=Exidia glandulosa HHB12029 TaxID=1314781 RepID=A0A165IM74_EXIGL|nr:hypothetical protein EXIGLDRAFT_835597 [Exidia glandulosa HHB12029]